MPAKRASMRPSAGSAPAAASSPLMNAALLGAAVCYGLWLLVSRGRVSWPPSDLIANAYTLAGCLALVGPIVLARREGAESGVGDLLWMTGGAAIWIFNLAAFVRGDGRFAAIATPIPATTMGLAMLAVLVSAWKLRAGARSWGWTNVTGWGLGLFWVALAIVAILPGNPARLAVR